MNWFSLKLTNIVILIVSTFLLIFGSGNTSEPKIIDLDEFEITFADEFDGNELNTEKWRQHNAECVRKGGYWVLDQVNVNDGYLTITTEHLEDGKFGEGWYTGAISTEGLFEQNKGYFEVRCKLPAGNGQWSAFWLQSSNTSTVTGTGETGAEIDIFESPYYYRGEGRRNIVSSNIHYNGYGLLTKYKNVGIFDVDNPYEEFHTYGLEWTESSYIFYIDGVETNRSDFGGISQVEEFLILSCEVDGAQGKPGLGWSGKITDNDDGFSTEFVVDYVRVYEHKQSVS